MADDLAAQIMRDYPSFGFLLSDPEIGPLLLDAVNPEIGFDSATFQAKLLQTQWWKTHGAAQRQWVTLLNTDPAQAEAKKTETRGQIRTIVGQAGLNLDDGAIEWLTTNALNLGVEPGSATFKSWLAQNWDKPGIAQNNIPGLRAIAERDYMVPVDDRTLAWWTGQMAAGYQTEQSFRATMANLAAGRYVGFADRINAGETPSAIFGSYRQTIAQELELPSADSVDLMRDPRWSQVTGVRGADGKIVPMTLSETISLARSQPEWKMTQGANTMAGDLATKILTDFGAIA